MKIECKTDQSKKVKTFFIEGDIDVNQVKELKIFLLENLEKEEWVYQIDMTGVFYLDSSGLGMLVYLKKEILRYQGKFLIKNLNDSVLNVFKLTKLDDFFEIP